INSIKPINRVEYDNTIPQPSTIAMYGSPSREREPAYGGTTTHTSAGGEGQQQRSRPVTAASITTRRRGEARGQVSTAGRA
ncbi:hypothetical protein Ancab_007683, partial [Ancistrocladus abbreviatus]